MRRVCPRSKAAHAGSPWITALIESLSDVPWSRVILLPKQLLSSVVYSHLFHPAEPDRRTLPFSSPSRASTHSPTSELPTLHTPELPTPTISHDLSPPAARHLYSPDDENTTRPEIRARTWRSVLSTITRTTILTINFIPIFPAGKNSHLKTANRGYLPRLPVIADISRDVAI